MKNIHILPTDKPVKHEGRVLSEKEVIANRCSVYEFIDFDKQETLEEYINNVTKNFKDEMSIKFTSSGIKLGAKWQAEQDKNKFSQEDMKEAYKYGRIYDMTFFEEWFEQFKKK